VISFLKELLFEVVAGYLSEFSKSEVFYLRCGSDENLLRRAAAKRYCVT